MESVAGQVLEPTHITSHDLARRWRLHPKTLANWRHQGRGPRWFKMPGGRRVLYLLEDVYRFERGGQPLPEDGQPGAPAAEYVGP